MDIKQLSSLLVKVAGIVLIVYAISGIPNNINSYLFQGKDTAINFAVWVIIPVLFPFLIGMAMWKFPTIITNKVINGVSNEVEGNTFRELELIALTILGLVLLFFALSDITFNLIYVWATNQVNNSPVSALLISPEDWGHIAGTFVEIIFALVLLFRSKGVIGIIKKFRE